MAANPGALPDHLTGVLPDTMGRALRAEFRRSFRPPFESPSVVVINGLLMSACWFLLPPDWFFRVHAPLFYPISLLAWMLADVPTTNVLGSDAARTAAALERPVELRRILLARQTVLWLLIVPIASVAAVVVGIVQHEAAAAVVTTVFLVGVGIWGPMAIAAWLGVRYPYHPLPLRLRWDSRRTGWKGLARWGTLVLLPYVWVPWMCVGISLPVVLLWQVGSGRWPLPDPAGYVWIGIAAVIVSAAAWWLGMRVSLSQCRRHSAALRAFLADPARG